MLYRSMDIYIGLRGDGYGFWVVFLLCIVCYSGNIDNIEYLFFFVVLYG